MIPLTSLFTYCRKMLSEKWGYIWGTAGIKWTQARQDDVSDDMARRYGKKWIGHMVADCSGVMVYIWKQYGLSIYHGSNTIARKYVGKLTKTPSPGYAAFKWRSSDTPKFQDGKGDFYHIGIVAEDGITVYESKGTQTGFTTSKASAWQYFAPFKDVDYNKEQKVGDTMTGYVNTVSGSLNVRAEPNSKAAIVTRLEKGAKVTILGEDGDWYKISNGYVSKKYIQIVEDTPSSDSISLPYWGVTIPCDTKQEAENLIKQYSGAILINYQTNNGEDG